MQYLADVKQLRGEIAENQHAAHRVNREEVLFGYKPTSFVSLHVLKDQIEPHVALWTLVADWQKWHQEWMHVLALDIARSAYTWP